MSVNPVRRLKGPERRVLVLDAARNLFAANGYDAVSMRDIATAAGITRPVLYDHFPSKKDLVLDLLTTETEALLARITAEVAAAPEARLPRALRAYFTFMLERPLATRLILSPTKDPDISEVVAHLSSLSHRGILALLPPPNPRASPHTPDIAATILVSSVVAVANWWLTHPEVPVDELVGTTLALLSPGFSQS
ncbi:TetR/AcrR family transcriptional regulator [Nocardia sp. NPDC056000]|uniref:TetR/AcrR family transcriptional regulator n=1 Tax=Nocardia sp. NPDC056000 TaxID=3345674 RepID=UPI0035D7D161